MKAEEARKLAEQFTPDVKEILDLIRIAAMNGKFSVNPPSNLIIYSRVREHLELLGYKTTFHDVQGDGYWVISW